MTKRVIRRLFDTFFRRWWLYILPLVLFTAVGVSQAAGGTSGYRSVGVVSVSTDTVLSQLTQIRGEGFGYETPAAATSRTINSLLGTKRFLDAVAERAEITEALETGLITEQQVRQSISATPGGDQLVQVIATTEFPEVSQALARATIDSYRDYVIEGKVSQSRAAEEFFARQLDVYEDEVRTAERALDRYVQEHGGSTSLESRPLDEQIVIEQLQGDIAGAEARLAAAQQKSEDARLETEKAEGDVTQRLRTHDEPQLPGGPEPRRKEQIMTVMIFAFVGLLLTAGLVGLAVFADRTFRAADDVEHALGVKVIAVVPEIAA